MTKTKWEMVPPQPKPIRVRWWWYVILLAAFAVTLAIVLTACGGDTGFTEDDYDWFNATSPSGVQLECLGYGEGLWCREVGEP